MVYTYTFSAAIPNFRCENPTLRSIDLYTEKNNDIYKQHYEPTKDQCKYQQKTISIKECQRCFMRTPEINSTDSRNSSLKPCGAYVYDRQYYQKTLVEEVIYILSFLLNDL